MINYIENFNCDNIFKFMYEDYYKIPAISSVFYLLLIFNILPNINLQFNLKHGFAMWNLFLSIFSLIGFIPCIYYVISTMYNEGIHYILCNDYTTIGDINRVVFYNNINEYIIIGDTCVGFTGFMVILFIWSKIFEFIDTFFLALMKKPIIFLHWYHHIYTLIFCWYSYINTTPVGILFITMNYFVHMVMYFYFFASQYTKKLNFMRKPITTIQILQMIFGIIFIGMIYYYDKYSDLSCSTTYKDNYFFEFCGIMYGSYCLLFMKLYYENYIKKQIKHKE